MKEVLNVGVIGLGNRGSSLLENCILPQPGVRVQLLKHCPVDDLSLSTKRSVKESSKPGRSGFGCLII